MARLALISAVVILGISSVAAVADIAPPTVERQAALLQQRADVQKQIEDARRQLHRFDLDRRDNLEELDELLRAHADLDQRRAFSQDIENEIASQKRNLHRIEQQRSDCLDELDGLYRSLTDIDYDVADSYRALH